MRKFSKILTVLLTLALLCGVIMSVFASAAEGESREALNITQANHNRYTDFESKNSSDKHYVELQGQNWTNVQVEYPTDANGNTYGRYVAQGHSNASGNAELYIMFSDHGLGNHRSGISNIGAHDYMVVDFELGSDQYAFSYVATITLNVPGVDGAEATTETVTATLYKTVDTKAEYDAFVTTPSALAEFVNKAIYEVNGKTISNIAIAVNDDLDIAHIDGMSYNLHGRGADKLSTDQNKEYRKEIYSGTLVYTVKDKATGKWYLGTSSTYGASGAKYVEISNVPGEFTHVTYVVKTVRTASPTATTGYSISGSRAYIFVDGECVKSNVDMGIGSYESWSPAWIRIALGTDNKKLDRYSICFDNVAINWYGYRPMKTTTVDGVKTYTYSTVDTVYVSEGYGIDDYITSGDFATKGLWVCEDVVYDSDYVNPNGKENIAPKIAALDNGDVLNIKSSYANVDVPANLLGFKVVAEDGAKFSLSAASLARYDVVETVDGTTTTYVINAKVSAFINDSYGDMTGGAKNSFDNYNTTSGKWSAYRGSATAKEVVEGANGNKYMRLSFAKSGYASDIWKNTSAQVGPANNGKYSDYKYTTIDIDLAVDSYVYSWTEQLNGKTATKYSTSLDDIPEGVTPTKGNLAYYDGFYYYLRATDGGATPSNSGLMNVTTGKDATTGLYYVTSGNANGKKITLANEIGVFDHYTFVLGSRYDASGAFIGADIYCYVNGELLYHVYNTSIVACQYLQKLTMTYKYSHSIVDTYYPAPEGDTTGNKANKEAHLHEFNDKYSVLFDNFAVNFYSESDINTKYLEAFFSDFDADANLASCKGVVYNENYVGPNAGEYITINGVKTYNPAAFASQVANVKNGAVIETNTDLLNVTPVGDKTFTVKLLDGAKFTLSEEAVKGLWFTSVEGDVVTVYCRANESTTFNFVDAEGNVIASEILLPGMSLNVSDKSALIPESFDKISGSVVGVTAWTIDLGNGAIDANGYTLGVLDVEEVTVTPTIGALATINTYAIYVVDENGNTVLVGSASDYASMDSFKKNIEAAPSGATAVLLYDKNEKVDIGVQTNGANAQIVIAAGKTFSLDLNGRTLVDSASNYNVGAWGDRSGCTFNVKDNTTFNFYSSQDGAAWYQLKYSSSGDSRIYSKGIVTSDAKVATVNFGDVYDEKGNLIIDSADFTVYGSLVEAYTASGATTANTEFNINVNGGTYHSGMGIGRYAMITSYLPVTNVTINNATLINDTRDGYAIFSIWYNNSIFNVTAKNSTLISVGPSGAIEFDGYHKEYLYDEEGNPVYTDKNGNIVYEKNKDGSLKLDADGNPIKVHQQADFTDNVTYNHYYENCTIIATKYGNNGYTGVTLGEGNFLSGMTYLKRADGVASVKASTSVLLNYPKAINKAPLAKDGKTEQLDGSSFKKVVIGETTYYTIADSLYDVETWKNEVLYAAGGYYTYKGEIPADIFDKVSFKTTDGKLLATELWFKDRVGEDNFALAQPANVDLGMYTANGATWSATDKADEFVLAGYTGATGNFKDMLVNAALSTGMTYNIYVPADAGITITGVEGGTLAEKLYSYNGKSYFVISTELAAADFEAKNVTVTFTAESIVGGDAVTGTQTLVADIVGYANKVNETFKHDTEESILIVNMMEYKVAVAQALALSTGKEYVETEATAAFFAAHQGCYCSDVAIEEPADEYYYIKELINAGLKGATFTMDSVGEIKLVFEPKDAANTDLVITVKYSDLRRTYTLVATYNAEAKCYITPGIPAAYIDNAFSITVGDGEAVGIYSLYAYIEEMSENEDENEYYIYVANALAEYAAAAEAYKYITTDEVE